VPPGLSQSVGGGLDCFRPGQGVGEEIDGLLVGADAQGLFTRQRQVRQRLVGSSALPQW
jgi:hypothetical protein